MIAPYRQNQGMSNMPDFLTVSHSMHHQPGIIRAKKMAASTAAIFQVHQRLQLITCRRSQALYSVQARQVDQSAHDHTGHG